MFPRFVVYVSTLALISPNLGCLAGEVRDRHASLVETYERTPLIDPDEPFLDPARALGPPDGRTLALGMNAYVTLRFFREIPDAPGPDLRVYEVGPDAARAKIAVSRDAAAFVEFEAFAEGPTTELDLAETEFEGASFVRVRGMDNLGIDPGFDLDALEALH